MCSKKFKIHKNIIDFRNTKDFTKDFDHIRDFTIGKILLKHFKKFKTFNSLKLFFSEINKLKNFDDKKILNIIKTIPKVENKLDKSQLIHGYDILYKKNLFRKEFKLKKNKNNLCLENGGGHGLFVDGFSKKFKNVIFLDISFVFCVFVKKIIEERKIKNVLIICANVEKLPIKNDTLDFIHSNNAIEHLNNQDAMISESFRTIKKKGCFLIVSPNKKSIYFEPHFRFPLYGFIPFKIRFYLIKKLFNRDCTDVHLLDLNDLKKKLFKNFKGNYFITFIPSQLKRTAQQNILRKVIIYMLKNKITNKLILILFNKIFLNLMPYHVAICQKK